MIQEVLPDQFRKNVDCKIRFPAIILTPEALGQVAVVVLLFIGLILIQPVGHLVYGSANISPGVCYCQCKEKELAFFLHFIFLPGDCTSGQYFHDHRNCVRRASSLHSFFRILHGFVVCHF